MELLLTGFLKTGEFAETHSLNRCSAGVRFTAAETMEASASQVTAQDFYAAKHTTDLTARPDVLVNPDHAQRGLGTASGEPDTLSQFRIPAGSCAQSFSVSSTAAATSAGNPRARRPR